MMHERILGRTGLRVTPIALGTVELGLDYGIPSGDHRQPSHAVAGALLHAALDRGVRLIDTARAYGAAEEIIGTALAARHDEYVLATKVSFAEDGDADAIRRGIEASLATSRALLRRERLDLVLLHSAGVAVLRQGVALGVLDDYRRAGVIGAIGASTYGEAAALAALDDPRCDVLQIAYNLLDRRPEAHVLPRAAAAGVAIVVRSVLLKGVLTHRAAWLPDALAPLRQASRQLAAIAARAGVSLPELAYRHVLEHPAVSAALVGTAHQRELDDALGFAAGGPLDAATRAAIRAVTLDDERLLDPPTWPAM
jgi:aryl-alcohol dehydrogenase-like predicted oxidoreductase